MDTEDPVELKAIISGLQRELEQHQLRSRRLFTAMTLKLQVKDRELCNLRHLRDRQLKQVLNQLLTFQSGLAQQKNEIHNTISEKDTTIETLRLEVTKLKEENKKLIMERSSRVPTPCSPNNDKDNQDDDSPAVALAIPSEQEKTRTRPTLPPKPKLKPKPIQKPKPPDKKVLKSGLKSVNGVSKEVKRTVRFNLDCDYRYDSDASDMTECDTTRPVSILDTINRLLEKDSSPVKGEENNISLKLQPLKQEIPVQSKTYQIADKPQSILKLSKSDSDIVKPAIRTTIKKQLSDAQIHSRAQTSDSDLGSSNESLSSIESPSKDKNNPKTRNDILKDVSDHMVRQNFEEFKLEIVEEDEQNKRTNKKEVARKEGDGAESGSEQSIFESDYRKLFYFNGSYEKFLEATGLSQKSLLSPSRLMNNHRSVLKPKDVKNRSKIKAALNLSGPEDANGIVKYWTEPFL